MRRYLILFDILFYFDTFYFYFFTFASSKRPHGLYTFTSPASPLLLLLFHEAAQRCMKQGQPCLLRAPVRLTTRYTDITHLHAPLQCTLSVSSSRHPSFSLFPFSVVQAHLILIAWLPCCSALPLLSLFISSFSLSIPVVCFPSHPLFAFILPLPAVCISPLLLLLLSPFLLFSFSFCYLFLYLLLFSHFVHLFYSHHDSLSSPSTTCI